MLTDTEMEELPRNPMLPPAPARSDADATIGFDRPGFSRGGFAPIPHRHEEFAMPMATSMAGSMGASPMAGKRPREEFDRPPPPRQDRSWEAERERDFGRRDFEADPEFDRFDRRERRRDWDDEYGQSQVVEICKQLTILDRLKRRRSPSPVGQSHRPRLHSPSPPPRSLSNLPDPATLPNLLSFREFVQWFKACHPQTAKADEEEYRKAMEKFGAGEGGDISKERVGIGKRYERYRREYTSRQLFALYLQHRDSKWFEERYSVSPEAVALRRRVNRQGRVMTVEKYLDALKRGEYDAVNYDMMPEAQTSESGRRAEEEHVGLDRALDDLDKAAADPLRVEVPAAKAQVFVKSVPPNASRVSLEKLFQSVPGFRYLALTEPAMKKAFHRVAWAQFSEDVDINEVVGKLADSKIDNFTFHMGVNTTAVIGRTRSTPAIANTLERLKKDAETTKALAIRLEDELVGDDEDQPNEDDAKDKDGDQNEMGVSSIQVPSLRERGSALIEERISAILDSQSLDRDVAETDEEVNIRKVRISGTLVYTCEANTMVRQRPLWINGFRTSAMVSRPVTTALRRLRSLKSFIENVFLICELFQW
jgi:hypothetical protein